MAITLVAVKGGPLTAAEFDGNFTDLNTRLIAVEDADPATPVITSAVSGFTWTLTFNGETFTHSIPSTIQRPPHVQVVTGATRVLSVTDANTYLRCSNATGCAITVPTYAVAAIAPDDEIRVAQAGAGPVSIVAQSGVTINKRADLALATDTQGAVFTLKKIATNEWDLFGDLADA